MCVEWNCHYFFLFHLSYFCLFLCCLLVLPYYMVNKDEYIIITWSVLSYSVNWQSLHQRVFVRVRMNHISWIWWNADDDREILTDWLADLPDAATVVFSHFITWQRTVWSIRHEVVTVPTTCELITSLWRQLAGVWRHSAGTRSVRSQIIFDSLP